MEAFLISQLSGIAIGFFSALFLMQVINKTISLFKDDPKPVNKVSAPDPIYQSEGIKEDKLLDQAKTALNSEEIENLYNASLNKNEAILYDLFEQIKQREQILSQLDQEIEKKEAELQKKEKQLAEIEAKLRKAKRDQAIKPKYDNKKGDMKL